MTTTDKTSAALAATICSTSRLFDETQVAKLRAVISALSANPDATDPEQQGALEAAFAAHDFLREMETKQQRVLGLLAFELHRAQERKFPIG